MEVLGECALIRQPSQFTGEQRLAHFVRGHIRDVTTLGGIDAAVNARGASCHLSARKFLHLTQQGFDRGVQTNDLDWLAGLHLGQPLVMAIENVVVGRNQDRPITTLVVDGLLHLVR